MSPRTTGLLAAMTPHRWALLLILAWPVILFGPAVLQGGVLAPADGIGMYLPQRTVMAAAWQSLAWPFWHPFQFSGMPLLPVIQAGVFYPGNWTFLVLPPGMAMNVTVLLAYWVAGLGAWLYGRAIGLPASAVALLGLVFLGSGYMVSHLEHLTMLHAAGMVPVLFWIVERAFQGGAGRWALAFAPCLALQVFGGYPQTVVMTALMLGPYATWRAWQRGPEGLAVLVRLAAAAGLGLGLAAVQLVPTAGLMAESSRGTMTYAELVDDSLPVRELTTWLFPYMYGTWPDGPFQVPFWGKGPWRDELMGYAGLLTWMLALVALFARRGGLAWFWGATAGVAGLLALGGQTPLYRLWHELPVFRMIRVPGRHLLELDWALAVLAGLGLAWLLAAAPDLRRRAALRAVLAVGGGMGLLGLGVVLGRDALVARWQPYAPAGLDLGRALEPTLAWFWVPVGLLGLSGVVLLALSRSPRPALVVWAIGVLGLDLWTFGWYQGWRAQLPKASEVAIARAPTPHDGPRVLPLASRQYPFYRVADAWAVGQPQTSALASVRAVNGYEPIVPARYASLMGRMAMGGAMAGPDVLKASHHGLDLLQCATVRLDRAPGSAHAGWQRWLTPPRWVPAGREGTVAVYRNSRALPRGWRPERVRSLEHEDLAAAVTASSALVPTAEGLVDQGVTLPAAVAGGAVTVRTLGYGVIGVETDGAASGLVVVSEGYATGWRAVVGTHSAREAGGLSPTFELALARGGWAEHPVVRAYGLVIGVLVPPGPHRFTLVYRPPGWYGAWLVTLLCVVLWLLWAGRRRRGIP